ncbi:hypothetical protein HK098_002937, partial [Nowakowskiella sp. JEL0407]
FPKNPNLSINLLTSTPKPNGTAQKTIHGVNISKGEYYELTDELFSDEYESKEFYYECFDDDDAGVGLGVRRELDDGLGNGGSGDVVGDGVDGGGALKDEVIPRLKCCVVSKEGGVRLVEAVKL